MAGAPIDPALRSGQPLDGAADRPFDQRFVVDDRHGLMRTIGAATSDHHCELFSGGDLRQRDRRRGPEPGAGSFAFGVGLGSGRRACRSAATNALRPPGWPSMKPWNPPATTSWRWA